MWKYFLCLLPSLLSAQDFQDYEQVFSALARAYPYHIKIVAKRHNPRPLPALLVRDRLFYWVEGRILPAEAIEEWQDYAPTDFYYYPKNPEDPLNYTPELTEYLERTAREIRARTKRLSAHPDFWNTLYASATRSETENNLITGRFLKRLTVVHRFAWGPLKKVEEELLGLAKTDASVREFLGQIDRVYTFSWRTIAKSKKRSLHSYGISVDTVNSRSKKPVYWLWQHIADPKRWAKTSRASRWAPPALVIETFEKHGFAWGGKWFFYDTIHFEYRPEILILNGYEGLF